VNAKGLRSGVGKSVETSGPPNYKEKFVRNRQTSLVGERDGRETNGMISSYLGDKRTRESGLSTRQRSISRGRLGNLTNM